MKNLLFAILLIIMITSCNNQTTTETEQKTETELIGKKELTLKSKLMTPEVLWSFGRVSDVQVSPDQAKILYGVSYYSIQANKGNRELFVMNMDGSDVQQLTKTPGGEYNAIWKPDDSKIAFPGGDRDIEAKDCLRVKTRGFAFGAQPVDLQGRTAVFGVPAQESLEFTDMLRVLQQRRVESNGMACPVWQGIQVIIPVTLFAFSAKDFPDRIGVGGRSINIRPCGGTNGV